MADVQPTKGRLIQFFQGNKMDLPILEIGEPAFCVDTKEFYIGSEKGNIRFISEDELSDIYDAIQFLQQQLSEL